MKAERAKNEQNETLTIRLYSFETWICPQKWILANRMNSATNVRSFWVVFRHHIVFQRMCHETNVSCKSCITSRVVYTMRREKNQQRPAAMTKTATNNMKHRPKVRFRSITVTLRIRRDGRGNWGLTASTSKRDLVNPTTFLGRSLLTGNHGHCYQPYQTLVRHGKPAHQQ